MLYNENDLEQDIIFLHLNYDVNLKILKDLDVKNIENYCLSHEQLEEYCSTNKAWGDILHLKNSQVYKIVKDNNLDYKEVLLHLEDYENADNINKYYIEVKQKKIQWLVELLLKDKRLDISKIKEYIQPCYNCNSEKIIINNGREMNYVICTNCGTRRMIDTEFIL